MKPKILILKIETYSIKKTIQIIRAMMGQELFTLGEGMEKEYIKEVGPWKHIKKKGK